MAVVSTELTTHADVHDLLHRRLGHFIDGEWVSGGDVHPLSVVSPATGLTIASVDAGGAVEINNAVMAARAAFDAGVWWKQAPVDRARVLFELADIIEAHAEQIAHLEALDIGVSKSMMKTIGVKLAADQLRYYAGWITKLNGETMQNSRPHAPGREFLTYTVKEPIGVVGQIIPWNFPFGMSIGKLAPAIAAGCSVVMKPAEEAPLSVAYLANLIAKTKLPPGVFNLVNGVGRKAGAALARHPDVDKISFTGSTSVGRDILSAARENLKKVTLELGGKSPVVVLKDADLEETIPAVARAIFFLSGQNCMAGSRVLVHKDIHDNLVEGLVEIAESMSIGSDLENTYDLGPLISKRQLTRVLAYIDTGLGEGAV
ncbi:MAG TPA: aldehyde dehydrogenase family protein, partial [Hellea balneolensis]|nr:aldehyde dehydrogenase family protein [Hellea balneolensis]